jgi:hypothetical protein
MSVGVSTVRTYLQMAKARAAGQYCQREGNEGARVTAGGQKLFKAIFTGVVTDDGHLSKRPTTDRRHFELRSCYLGEAMRFFEAKQGLSCSLLPLSIIYVPYLNTATLNYKQGISRTI